MRRRSARSVPESSAKTSLSSINTFPDVGSCNRSIVRPTVVFPEPDSPTNPSVRPEAIANEMPSTARTGACGRPRPNQRRSPA